MPAVSCVVLAIPGTVAADPPRSAASARAQIVSLDRDLHGALLELYALDSQLASARARLVGLEARAERLRAQQRILVAELRIARRGLRVSQQRLDVRLRLIYRQGTTSTLEVLLGSSSLGEALTGLESLNRVTLSNREVLDELAEARSRSSRASRVLAARSASLAATTRDARATARSLETARDDRSAYVSDLRRRLELSRREVARLEAAADAATDRTMKLASTARPAASGATALVAAGPTGARTMTVSAVAYSLPGHTASGLPVGWGIVAVDPRVIPLGTRLYVPGYGEAVAADTGTAVVGPMIDLWFPTYEQAAAWGRQSVTITIR